MDALSLAHVPGGALEGVGEPREHTGSSSGCWSAGEELAHIKGSRCEGAVSAEMAGHRSQRPQRDQELRKHGFILGMLSIMRTVVFYNICSLHTHCVYIHTVYGCVTQSTHKQHGSGFGVGVFSHFLPQSKDTTAELETRVCF